MPAKRPAMRRSREQIRMMNGPASRPPAIRAATLRHSPSMRRARRSAGAGGAAGFTAVFLTCKAPGWASAIFCPARGASDARAAPACRGPAGRGQAGSAGEAESKPRHHRRRTASAHHGIASLAFTHRVRLRLRDPLPLGFREIRPGRYNTESFDHAPRDETIEFLLHAADAIQELKLPATVVFGFSRSNVKWPLLTTFGRVAVGRLRALARRIKNATRGASRPGIVRRIHFMSDRYSHYA